MNIKNITIILIFSLTFSNAQHKLDISFEEIESEYCRNCYGSLIVKKNKLSDTIYGGQWGHSVNYKLIKIKEKEYLNTYYHYGFPGGQTVMVYKIHSLENKNFLKPIFEKSFELYRETHRNYNDIPVNYVFERTVDVELKKGIEFDINLKVSHCPEIEGKQCDKIFEESYVDFYNIN